MSDEQTKGGAETPSGGGQRRPTSRPPWIVVVAALAVALYAVLSIATQIETYRTSCAHTGEFCDGMESLYSAMFTGGMIGSFLIMLCGWKIWQRRRWAWLLSIAYFTGATLWTLNSALQARDELEFSWIAVPFVLNVVIAGWLLLPQVVRWCRPDRADRGSPNTPGSTERRP